MIEDLKDLGDALAAAAVTTDDVVAWLGGRSEDLGSNVLVEHPSLDGVVQANVVRDGTAPAFVTLELDRALDPDSLSSEWGEPRHVYPDHPGQPVDLLFEMRDGVTLIAAEGREGIRRLTLRRDL